MDNTGSRLDAIRQTAESIRNSNLFNDSFASIALEDVEAFQHVVRTILGRNDIRIIDVKGQYRLLNMTSKDAVLDALAEDANGRMINIELQRRDTVDHARRTRYYGSMIDKSVLDKGKEYMDLPDVYVIYISETDIWHAGKTVYCVTKSFEGTDIPYDDGRHVIYVNAAVDDGSAVAELMHYFTTADPDDMSQGGLSQRVHFLKSEKGGFDIMCEAAEKLYDQGQATRALTDIRNLMANLKLTAEQAMNALGIPVEDQPLYLTRL